MVIILDVPIFRIIRFLDSTVISFKTEIVGPMSQPS